MAEKIQITFSEDEMILLEKEAAKRNVPVVQLCKDIILSTDFQKATSQKGMFSKNYAIVIGEMKNHAKKHSGTFQLRDLRCWSNVWQQTFGDELVFSVGQRIALGKNVARAVAQGQIPGVKIATKIENGETVPVTLNGSIVYEIIPIGKQQALDEREEKD